MTDINKVAIVTGASRGIGAGLVEKLLERGYRVVANARHIESRPSNGQLVALAGDVADRHTAEELTQTAIERFGRIDLLVNGAGTFVARPFVSYDNLDFASLVGTNLAGFFHLTQLTVQHMVKQGSGHVVNISTSLAEQPQTGVPATLSILTKGALNAATRALAIEFAATGVRANAVSPGIIDTPMHKKENHPFLHTLHPVGHMGTVKDIVDAVLYLEDATFITGEILHVDGGSTAGRW